jgi:hypothetical protein
MYPACGLFFAIMFALPGRIEAGGYRTFVITKVSDQVSDRHPMNMGNPVVRRFKRGLLACDRHFLGPMVEKRQAGNGSRYLF